MNTKTSLMFHSQRLKMIRRVPAQYYNYPQLAIKLSSRPHKMGIWGRGTGKTTILGDEIVDVVDLMPRGKIGFAGLTYFHLKTKSLPAIIDQWERRGYIRDLHYFIGHKAPKSYKWPEPYQPPMDYQHCVHFYNGALVELISFDRPEMARSGNYDYIFGDEITKLKKESLDSDVLASNRGNKFRFGHLRQHHGTTFFGTMPITASAQWVFDHENYMDQDPNEFLYLEASALDNIKVLGEKFFRDQKRMMPSVVYDLEILNLRPKTNLNGFYPKLSEMHQYEASYNYTYYDTSEQLPIDSRGDLDCDPSAPLDLSLDFGSKINCAVVGQSHGAEYRIVKDLYVDHPGIIDDLIKDFCTYYEHHKQKVVFLWGGADGRTHKANSKLTYFEQVQGILEKHGWTVQLLYPGIEAGHMAKYLFFNNLLSEEHPSVPALRMNKENAKHLIVSMQNAPIKAIEIKKDKSSERDPKLPQWKATHLSDAVDNLLYWKFYQAFESIDEFIENQLR